jgi:hypothetical protein
MNIEPTLISGSRGINTSMNYKIIIPIVVATALLVEIGHYPHSQPSPHLPEVEYSVPYCGWNIPPLSGANLPVSGFNTHWGV